MVQAKFKKQLSTLDLTMIALGAIFGSGWLFASSHVAAMAGLLGLSRGLLVALPSYSLDLFTVN